MSDHSNVRLIGRLEDDFNVSTAAALKAQRLFLERLLVDLGKAERLLGHELVVEPGTVATSTIGHETRKYAALLRSCVRERERKEQELLQE